MAGACVYAHTDTQTQTDEQTHRHTHREIKGRFRGLTQLFPAQAFVPASQSSSQLPHSACIPGVTSSSSVWGQALLTRSRAVVHTALGAYPASFLCPEHALFPKRGEFLDTALCLAQSLPRVTAAVARTLPGLLQAIEGPRQFTCCVQVEGAWQPGLLWCGQKGDTPRPS